MEDLEKKIEEAAELYGKSYDDIFGTCGVATDSFESGAKSPEAKAFHQQGMYTEEEVKEVLLKSQGSWIVYENPLTDRRCCTSNWEFEYFNIWFEQNKKK